MTITFKCLHCGQSLVAEQTQAPARVACTKCGNTVVVPQPIGGTLTGKSLAQLANSTSPNHPSASGRKPAVAPAGSPSVPVPIIPDELTAPAGLFQSNRCLVIARRRHRFPQHCLWCNAPAPQELTAITVVHFALPATRGESLVGAGRALAAYANREKCDLRVPICETCTARRLRKARILLIVALVFLGLTVPGFAFVSTSNRGPQDRVLIGAAIATVAAFTIGLIALFVSLFFKKRHEDYPVRLIDDQHVWMHEVHADFLAGLPKFPSELADL